MCEYQRNTDLSDFNVNTNTQDWHFPKKYFKSVGYTVDGFKSSFPKAKTAISEILKSTKNLLNIENGLEEVSNSFSSELFCLLKKVSKIELLSIITFQQKIL